MEFVNSPVKPGTNATIRVSGDPGSACSIGVVDKSIELLKADHQLTPEKVEHIQIIDCCNFFTIIIFLLFIECKQKHYFIKI